MDMAILTCPGSGGDPHCCDNSGSPLEHHESGKQVVGLDENRSLQLAEQH
jgi:hypothetical protein